MSRAGAQPAGYAPGSKVRNNESKRPALVVTPANRNKETIREVREVVMPRCPLCRSALVTITFGLYPIAICSSCSARWIQDGHQQRAINQVQEPTLFAASTS